MSVSNSYSNLQDNLQDGDAVAPEQEAATKTKSSRRRKSAGAFRTISEVADLLSVQQHVLRFWETKFSQIRPLKRGGGRRYYRPEDIVLLQRIHELLYTQGYTIKGVQKLLKEHGKAVVLKGVETKPTGSHVANSDHGVSAVAASSAVPAQAGLAPEQKTLIRGMLNDLKDLRDLLKK
jgi:DNA-binding transcriptional MerR regulator